MRFKILIILAFCVLYTHAGVALSKATMSPHEMTKFLKTCHQIEEAGSDMYGVGGNLTCGDYSLPDRRTK
ncbi:MAG TPA: hypothetical protein VMW10_04935 [Alphaproteobacteria bacterium]|nr:hypothetical protein [Alphaproteobacteria bacterium]